MHRFEILMKLDMSDTNRTYHAGVNNDNYCEQNSAVMCPEVCFNSFYTLKIIFGDFETSETRD